MRQTTQRCRRHGALIAESAIVYPVVFLLMLGIVIGGFGIFRYQEMAWLSREGARWASVRGGQYAQETGNAAATETSIRDYLRTQCVAIDPESLNVAASWDSRNWPYTLTADNGNYRTNTVTVTVTTDFLPVYIPILGIDPMNISSTSVMPMHY